MAEAKQGGIHVALGFPSWTAYIADVFKDNSVRLKGEARRELVAYLSDEGMSNRAIAGITGTDQRTVRRDRAAGAAGASPEEQCLKSVDRLGMGRTFPGDRLKVPS